MLLLFLCIDSLFTLRTKGEKCDGGDRKGRGDKTHTDIHDQRALTHVRHISPPPQTEPISVIRGFAPVRAVVGIKDIPRTQMNNTYSRSSLSLRDGFRLA